VDGDGVLDTEDNCLRLANGDQVDSDLDGAGDRCDPTDSLLAGRAAARDAVRDNAGLAGTAGQGIEPAVAMGAAAAAALLATALVVVLVRRRGK
jgi:hypothetical protein